MTSSPVHFSTAERDMRHFLPDSLINEQTLQRLLQAAHSAPSVGLEQLDWRQCKALSSVLMDDSWQGEQP